MLKFLQDKLWHIKYKRYLKSSRWKAKRWIVLQRDNFICSKCKRKHRLQIHHLTYKNVFHEPLRDLVTLCRLCHKKQHKRYF